MNVVLKYWTLFQCYFVEVLKQCGNCRNVISLLILFCPCQKSDDTPRNFREAPRDDKIKLFHELWWEHFWSWRYHSHSRDWNRFVEEQPQEYKKEISSRWSEIKWDQGFPPFPLVWSSEIRETWNIGGKTTVVSIPPFFRIKRCEIGFHHKIRCHKTIFFVITENWPNLTRNKF